MTIPLDMPHLMGQRLRHAAMQMSGVILDLFGHPFLPPGGYALEDGTHSVGFSQASDLILVDFDLPHTEFGDEEEEDTVFIVSFMPRCDRLLMNPLTMLYTNAYMLSALRTCWKFSQDSPKLLTLDLARPYLDEDSTEEIVRSMTALKIGKVLTLDLEDELVFQKVLLNLFGKHSFTVKKSIHLEFYLRILRDPGRFGLAALRDLIDGTTHFNTFPS